MQIQSDPDALEELRRLLHDEGVAEVVFGAELGVQALPADADRSSDSTHPDRRPATIQDALAGRFQSELAQPGPAESAGLGTEVDDGHSTESAQATLEGICNFCLTIIGFCQMLDRDDSYSGEIMTAATAATTRADRPYDPADISSVAFWSMPAKDREKVFAELRANRPISWHEPVKNGMFEDPNDQGFWAVVRHADLVEVTRRPADFLSGEGIAFESIPRELLDAAQGFIAMDPRGTPRSAV